MRDIWFSDKRDLVKWAVMFHLAEAHEANRIIQIAYYRPSHFGQVTVDNEEIDFPVPIIDFFRNINNIENIQSEIAVNVFRDLFDDRRAYNEAAIDFINQYAADRCVVFLDPDTGLEPLRPSLNHVLNAEALNIFNTLKPNDIFVLYKHKTNQSNEPWIEPKRIQLANALGLQHENINIAHSLSTANDVVFFYIEKA